MENSTAYQVGQIVGITIVILFLVGLCVLFIVALVKAIKTRRTGWVITAAISGLPLLAVFVAFLVGMVVGVGRAVSRSAGTTLTHGQDAPDLLKGPMTAVTGNAMSYKVSLPSLDSWGKEDSKPPFDYLFAYHDAYLGVIAENVGVGTPERICEISRKNLASKASACTATQPAAVDIDSRSWLTFDADATITGIKFKYRYYAYSDSERTVQIVAWAGPSVFERYAPVFDRIAKSFELPKTDLHSAEAASPSRETTIPLRQASPDFLKEPMTAVTGNALPYQVSLPSLDSWGKEDSKPPFDYLFLYHDAYFGIVAENIGVGTPERICEISRKNLASKASACTTTQPVALTIDSCSWLTFDADATITGIRLKYRYYVYSDSERTIQILAWTGPVVFERYAPVFDRIATSFKFPKTDRGSGQSEKQEH